LKSAQRHSVLHIESCSARTDFQILFLSFAKQILLIRNCSADIANQIQNSSRFFSDCQTYKSKTSRVSISSFRIDVLLEFCETLAANGLALGDFAAKRTDFYRQDRTFS
jgi:hypothetical protein